MMTERISIVITVYNRVEYLRQSVNSALSQADVRVQVIVVDDGSAIDPSPYLEDFKGLVEIHQIPNGGPAAARNHGIRCASGEYLLFLDDDDFLEPGALRALLSAADGAGGAAWVAGKYRYVDRHGNPTGVEHRCRYQSGYVYSQMIRNNLIGAPSTVLARREVLQEVRGFDESRELQMCEDYDLWLTLARQHPIVAIADVVSNYRVHGLNATANRAALLKVRLRTLTKHKRLAPKGLESEFEAAIAATHGQLGDALYLAGEPGEARLHWRDAARHGQLAPMSYFSRLTKSYIPKRVQAPLRSAAGKLRSFRRL